MAVDACAAQPIEANDTSHDAVSEHPPIRQHGQRRSERRVVYAGRSRCAPASHLDRRPKAQGACAARTQSAPDLMQADRKRRVRIAPNLYQRPSDGKFEIGFSDSGGRWRIKTLRARNKTEARAERDLFLSKLRAGQVAAPTEITLAEVAAEYVAMLEASVLSGDRSARTLERYMDHLDGHILPELGQIQVQKLTADALAAFMRDRQATGLSSWTRKGMLTPLGRVLSLAVRRGYLSENPLRRLEPDELPKGKAKDEPRVLDRDEIGRLLAEASELYMPALATKVFSGLRAMELLGLCWSCVDFDRGVITVRHQLTRASKGTPARLVELKTRGARRDVVLLPELAELLREHRRHAFQRGLAREHDYVFVTGEGTAVNYRNFATRGLTKAADRAELNVDGKPELTPHDLRHTFGSHLVRQGTDVVTVSRQMGHARPSITLDVYSHEFADVQHRHSIEAKLTSAFGGIIGGPRLTKEEHVHDGYSLPEVNYGKRRSGAVPRRRLGHRRPGGHSPSPRQADVGGRDRPFGRVPNAPHPMVRVAFLGGSIEELSEELVRPGQRVDVRHSDLPF